MFLDDALGAGAGIFNRDKRTFRESGVFAIEDFVVGTVRAENFIELFGGFEQAFFAVSFVRRVARFGLPFGGVFVIFIVNGLDHYATSFLTIPRFWRTIVSWWLVR